MPWPFTALMGTTGIPRRASSSLTSTDPPFAATSSIMFSASIMGTSSSRSCMVRYMLRSMLVASTMLMMASGVLFSRNSLVTISSWV